VVKPEPAPDAEPRPRRAGRFFALLAGLILIGSAGGAAWLHKTHKLADLAEQPPAIVVQIPEQAVAPVETASQAAEPAIEQTASAETGNAPAIADGNTESSLATGTPTTATETAPISAAETISPAPSSEATATAAATAETGGAAIATTEATATETTATETATAPTETASAMTEGETTPAGAESSAATPPALETAPATETATVPTTVPVPTTAEPTALATSQAAGAEATPPASATAIAESEALAESAVAAPVIPLPQMKPPPPAAPAPTLSAATETMPSAPTATEAATEAIPPAPASTPPGASLGAAATAEAIAAPAAATQTAMATPPAPASSGEPPWKKYARPFPADESRPRVSLVITGLGLTATQTQAAIDQLPPEITLAFSPYSGELQSWVAKARAAGHEVLIELPMEPLNYPADDPGPQALLASLSPAENLKRLEWVLARSDGVAGLVANMGSRFQANARLIRPVLTRLAEKGYLYIDNRSGPTSVIGEIASGIDLPWTYNTRFIDTEATRVSIDGRLQQLERTSREKGFALGLAQGYPVTIERVAAWARSLELKGLALAPASALAKTGAQ
jgi:uncharacterized protein